VSNLIRWDPALARAVAAELHERLAGRQAHPLPRFDRDRSATLLLDRGEALRFDLHPSAGWVRIVPRPAGIEAQAPTARIARVHAPADERLLRIDLKEGNRFKGGSRTLVVELHTNQWNALLVDSADGRIVSVMRSREAGSRVLHSGTVYAPPHGEPRFGARRVTREEAWAFWEATLGPVAPAERGAAFLRHFAHASPINARSLLDGALRDESQAELIVAFERWWNLHTLRESTPVILHLPKGPQPYCIPLDGVPYDPAASFLDAMGTVAELAAAQDASPADEAAERLLALARKRLASAERRVARVEQEMANVGEAERIRRVADHLLAYLQFVPEGVSSARLPGFDDGVEVEISLDPALRPIENAHRMYDEAGRRERAEQRLPELLEQARSDLARWSEAVALASVEGGELPGWAMRALSKEQGATRKSAGAPAARVPYRTYRTSGGLEVRVGRTSRDNDRLTFGHSAPDDVWLHARSVPGSHVILRWREADAPPARDLEEAATLAAVFSKARSSGTVAVDWTRRKHVRKPRGAPPGSVTLLHARTVFVQPDEQVEERLRDSSPEPTA
jgi:predicted ribosome quality control (RQC) complex YloA/Tae2 family protein